jgi:penicillin-binding protein 1C
MSSREALRTALLRLRRVTASVGARAWKARRRLAVVMLAVLASPFVLVLALAARTPLPPELLEPAAPSVRVLARDGKLLREVRADDGARARPLPLASFPTHARDAVLAAEDKGFYAHAGVDVTAVCRAALANLVHGRVVSGASTLTMQLARTLRPHRRGLWGKVEEAALAVRIEAALPKDRIFEEYLNRVTYGPNVRGYAAASHAYVGVAPESLSVAEAALVAGLPRGPSLYAVAKRPALAKKRRDRVLDRMVAAGMLDRDARDRAVAEPIVPNLEKPAFGAPHFVRGLVTGTLAGAQPGLTGALGADARLSEVRTTLDRELQRAAENAVTTTLASLEGKHVTAGAVVVLENATGDVLAYVGSRDFFDDAALGQNDGVRALRQPGSALKPFVYAEAMGRLGYTGATLLPDVDLHIPLPGGGDYVPHDYDTKLRGPVRLREALGNSLNVPAVYTLHELGTAPVLERLHAFGFASLTEDAEHYGPALALGDGEVTLLELANAYATLARGGLARPLRVVTELARGEERQRFDVAAGATRAVDERVAAMLTDILADKGARVAAFGEQNALEFDVPVAAKTGTSKGYRDNVAVGYTRDVTVAAWAGNFDGSPMADVSGISGAGPIFHAVMEAALALRAKGEAHDHARAALSLAGDAARLGLARTAVCALSGEIPTSACPHRIYEWLPTGDADHAPACSTHVEVRIDVRNGLRAGPACSPDETETRVLEQWSAPYDRWAVATGRPLVPAESSPACPAAEAAPDVAAASGGLRIAYPFDGASFVVDPERPAALQLLDVRVEPDTARVVVHVDGTPLASPRSWKLAPGTHTFVARAGNAESTPVRIRVR